MGNIQSYLDETGETNADEEVPQSAWGMVLTLGPVLAQAAIFMLIFLFVRRSQRRWYAPRTYLGSLREYERSPELPTGVLAGLRAFWKMPDSHALRHQSLDAYLFLRFLRVCCVIAFVGCCITWPVLLPINATGGGGQTQLELLSWSNVDTSTPAGRNRLFAHALVAWVFFGYVMYTILRESIYYINIRQAFLLTPQHARRISSRTVLFTSVPSPFLDESRLRKLFSDSVKHVWLVRDTDKVDDVVEERNKVAMKLEKAEVKLLKAVNAERIKAAKKGAGAGAEPGAASASVATAAAAADTHKTTSAATDATPPRDAETGDVADRWIPRSKRPSHRLGPLGLVGRKVDTIEWCRAELRRLVPAAEAAQKEYRTGGYDKIPAVFVEFHTQSDAQAAYQVVTHHQALHLSPKYIGVQPGEVIWKSLPITWFWRVVRRYAVLFFIVLLIVFWAVPTAIVGIISSVSTLQKLPFLTWLRQVPSPIMGLIGGLLPSVLMAVLLSLVPVIMRFCAKLAGEVSDSNVEIFTQKAYFIFAFVQLFLVRTIGNTASTLIIQVTKNPGSLLPTLSSAIPTSSNFYISYFMLQGFTIAAGVVTQIVGLVIFRLFYRFLAGTPRAMYQKWTGLSALLWGSLLPGFTNIAVISIVFAVIAPLELFWACVANGLFYLAYRYNVFFVTSSRVDTRGLIYPIALSQLFFGVYVGEVCLIGLFAVSAAPGPVVLMVVFLVFTVLFHITMKRALHPLMFNLPRNLMVEEESFNIDLSGAGGVDPGQPGTAAAAATAAAAPIGVTRPSVSADRDPGADHAVDRPAPAQTKRPGIVARFLRPWEFADYPTLRRLIPHENIDISDYTETTEAEAYFPPSVVNSAPLLWIPEDPAGVSKQEVGHTRKVIPITDEGCTLDDRNRIVWDEVGGRPPLWDEKVWY